MCSSLQINMPRWAATLLGRHAVHARRFSAQPAAAAAAALGGSAGTELASAGGPSGLLACTATGGLSRPQGADPEGSSGGGSGLTARYAALVTSGMLRPDPQQAACIQRLDRLGRELEEHAAALDEHQKRQAEYERRREALRRQLMTGEEARLLAEEEAKAAAASSRLAGLQNWLGAALGAPAEPPPPRRTPAQRRAVARARVERQLDERLGPAPAPPPAPKGELPNGQPIYGLCMRPSLNAC